MQTAQNFSEKLKKALDIYTPLSGDASSDIVGNANDVITTLSDTKCVRVPFVGDFSSGKSSIINAMLERDILPTAITPETSVPYELYYSPDEKMELYFNGVKVSEGKPSEISNLNLRPGNLVKLYLDSQLLKKMSDKGMLLVDMPGIDSGVEAHTTAINDYLTDGTHYMVFGDVEKGTFTNSALGFIKELTQYKGVDFSAFLTKADKKNPEAVENVRESMEKALSSRIGGEKKVGVTSASTGKFEQVTETLDSIDVESVIRNRFLPEVQNILDRMLLDLRRIDGLLAGDMKNAEKALAEIKAKKEEALNKLRSQKNDAQPLAESTDDIVADVKNGIISNSTTIASTIFSNKNNKDAVANAIIQVVRPILTNSLQREIEEYAVAISDSLTTFSDEIESILKNEGIIYDAAQRLIDPEKAGPVFTTVLTKSLETLIAKMAPYKSLTMLLKVLGKFLGPLTAIIINFIPDILKFIFGKSDQQKINEIQTKICDTAASQISEALRPTIQNILSEQRALADRQVEEMIENESKRIDASIKEMIEMKQREQKECEEKQLRVKEAMTAIVEIMQTL